MTSLLKFESTVYYYGFLCQLSQVTEEDWLSKTDLSCPHFFFWMLQLLLKDLIIIFLFDQDSLKADQLLE